MMKVISPIISAEMAVRNLKHGSQEFLFGGLLRDVDAFISGRNDIVRGVVGGFGPKLLELIPNRRILHQ
jgi:hypothetical protein